ncbi:MAG: sensor histidine kinase [Saccharofermentans sp.]|nr:sensor histidine kinase [Saccharofermentans sp.]
MKKNGRQITKIQRDIFGVMVLLIIIMTVITATISACLNIHSEKKHLEETLVDVSVSLSSSNQVIDAAKNKRCTPESQEYLDTFKSAISHVDVISIISVDGTRIYHTNKSLIGTLYDGTMPDFETNGNIYITSDTGPSGAQRRAYVALYDEEGTYQGFALVVLLNQNINRYILSTAIIYFIIADVIIVLSVFLSNLISYKIKHKLWGYEPDVFSAMYSLRDSILESFEEGIIAIDYDEKILFMNKAAQKICNKDENYSLHLKDYPMLSKKDIRKVLKTSEKIVGVQAGGEGNVDALISYYPVVERDNIIGALCVLMDRTEYTRIAEDLSGVKFLVDSMRANNHDFTNKLHVILGLIQMGANKEAAEYISNITSIQQETISNIMRNFENPSVAALLIGKYSKASELNISFGFEPGSQYRTSDVNFNSNDLITVIGNLIENAFDAMNTPEVAVRKLTVGIFTKPGAMILRVDDTGSGISDEVKDTIFDYNVTTKGENHGTGLFLVKQIVNRYSGSITVESEVGEGTSFTVTMVDTSGGNLDV